MNRLDNFSLPIIFAHRGASHSSPENTLAAFEKAIKFNADAVEFDVKLTKDQQVVIIHDNSLDRTTNGSGRVNNHTLSELKNLDAGSHFGSEYSGERIPTLDEVFSQLGNRIYLNVELTNYATPRDPLPQKVSEIVKNHKLQENILFSSFNFLTLYRIRRLLPEVPVAILALPGFPGRLARSFRMLHRLTYKRKENAAAVYTYGP
jgi:glycerophosphoryl diester phosphodiesterase